MSLRLYNTLTRSKEAFRPIDPAHVRMYVCGPTVYDLAHIGNARPIIVFDVLYRLLRQIYGPQAVAYVRNITDVDDKINARAAERGITIRELTEQTNAVFQADVQALGCLDPDVQPRATEHIAEMVDLIERLVAKGFAYVAEDHVLFSPAAMDATKGGWPRYGALANRSLDEMIAGARVDVAPYKREPTDFVLWKPSKTGEPGWTSPCGIATAGRPGWHIECSAMSWKRLISDFAGKISCAPADANVFDIHGGVHLWREVARLRVRNSGHASRVAHDGAAHASRPSRRRRVTLGQRQVAAAREAGRRGAFRGRCNPAVAVRELAQHALERVREDVARPEVDLVRRAQVGGHALEEAKAADVSEVHAEGRGGEHASVSEDLR